MFKKELFLPNKNKTRGIPSPRELARSDPFQFVVTGWFLLAFTLLTIFSPGCVGSGWEIVTPPPIATTLSTPTDRGACACDMDNDGVVTMLELGRVAGFKFNLFSAVPPVLDLTNVDLDKDGKINDEEYSFCSLNEQQNKLDGTCKYHVND